MTRMTFIRNKILGLWLGLVIGFSPAGAAPFGKVVPIGGHAADLALDEPRGVLYIANFTANRIEVMSLADGSIQTSMNVSSQPGSLSLSPDGRYLVVGHYGNFAAPEAPTNAVTVIDMATRGRQTFALGAPVLGVAFGADGLALVVTSVNFQLLDPSSGTTQLLETVSGLTAKTLPIVPVNPPQSIIAATVSASGDLRTIYGLTDTFTFRYDLERRRLVVQGYSSTPPMGPRAISVSRDGSSYAAGWILSNTRGDNMGEFNEPNGALDIGSHILDSSRGLLFSEVPTQSGGLPTLQPAILQVLDADNLRLRDRLQLAEHLSGKAVLTSDSSLAFAISVSGITILPVGAYSEAPRVSATEETLIFRGNFCDRRAATQEIGIVSGGSPADFQLSTTTPGIRFSPASGVTPATVRVSVDPNAFQNLKGTVTASIDIRTSRGVNLPKSIRMLINNREPDQRGTILNLSGKVVDILADPGRDRFFVLRQDANEVLVHDGTTYALQARLRTATMPTQMAITFDRRYLLVGHDKAQIISVFDMDTLETLPHIPAPGGHYPRSIAASGNAILVASRVAGPVHNIDRIDMNTRSVVPLPSLGVYRNDIDKSTMLVASANGSKIIAAQANGNLLLYDATADTFTISRREGTRLAGAVAASNFDQFVVGDKLLNASLVPVQTFESGTGQTLGFTFIDQVGLRASAPNSASPGVLQRVDLVAGSGIRPTRMAEAPYAGDLEFPFTRTVAPLYSRSVIVSLTTSGFTVLPWNYDASVAPPLISRVANTADGSPSIATGSLVSVTGQNLSPVNMASRELPLPTALGESCLTVNGVPTPVLFVSPTQINAQVPYNVEGNVTMILRTPGGVSDNFNLVVRPGAPAVFRNGIAGPDKDLATIVRTKNNEVVTLSNPIHRGDNLTIYLTGLGRTNPEIDAGVPAPGDPPLSSLSEPEVTLGGVRLNVFFAGLSPGQVGVYEIRADVPGYAPLGVEQPLTITQAGTSTTIGVRVVE